MFALKILPKQDGRWHNQFFSIKEALQQQQQQSLCPKQIEVG